MKGYICLFKNEDGTCYVGNSIFRTKGLAKKLNPYAIDVIEINYHDNKISLVNVEDVISWLKNNINDYIRYDEDDEETFIDFGARKGLCRDLITELTAKNLVNKVSTKTNVDTNKNLIVNIEDIFTIIDTTINKYCFCNKDEDGDPINCYLHNDFYSYLINTLKKTKYKSNF